MVLASEDKVMNIKSILSGVALLGSVIFSIHSQASEQVLATVRNDESQLAYNLVIDASEIDSSISAFYKDIYQGSKRVSRTLIDMSVLTTTGMVIEQRDSYTVLQLKSNNFDLVQGGIIEIDTLYNGATSSRKTYDIQLTKNKSAEKGWEFSAKGKAIKEIYIQTNRIGLGRFAKTVGIKNIVMK